MNIKSCHFYVSIFFIILIILLGKKNNIVMFSITEK